MIHGKRLKYQHSEVLEKLSPTLMNDFKGFKTLLEEVTGNVTEIARDPELEVEPESVTELLKCHKTWMDKELLLMDELRKWFIKSKFTPGDAVKIVEMTGKDLEYYIN